MLEARPITGHHRADALGDPRERRVIRPCAAKLAARRSREDEDG